MYTKIDNLLPRELLEEIEPFAERDEIIVILGARQVGKTCLLQYIQKRLKGEGKSTFFIDLEDIELRGAIKSAQDLLSYLREGHSDTGKTRLQNSIFASFYA